MINVFRYRRTLGALLLMTLHASLFILQVSAQDDFSPLFIGRVENKYVQSNFQDAPYLGDNYDLIRGDICYSGVVYENVAMRYDMLKQEVIVSSPESHELIVPMQQNVDWFTMNGVRYVHAVGDSTKYAALLLDGRANGLVLERMTTKKIGGNVLEDRRYVFTLDTSVRYLLRNTDGTIHEVSGAKDVMKIFPEQKQQLKQFVKENHLSFNKSHCSESLAKLVASVNTGYVEQQESIAPLAITLNSKPDTDSKLSTLNSQPKSGIPVLDDKTIQVALPGEYAASKTYVIPGVKKATQSLADDHELEEIVVVAGRQSAVKSVSVGSEKFKPELLKNIPSAFGESDIMKIVLTLPGVTTVGEASSGFNVRGGSTDQNLILFNGGTVYNPSHLFGLFTSFNSDMVEDVELFKASIPAQYGGRISSVLNVTSKEASMKKFGGSVSVGLLTSKLNLEVPIVKDHVSLLLNGRTTYSDWILKTLPEKSGYKNGSANFYDLGGVLTVKINDYHKLKINGYFSKDKFSFSTATDYGYTNRNLSLEWRSILSEKLTANLSVGADHYDYYNEDTGTASMAYRLNFNLDQLWAKLHFRHKLGGGHTLNYGLQTQHYDSEPGTRTPVGTSNYSFKEYQQEKALESAAYVEDEWKISDKVTVSAGVRMSMFNVLGPRNVNIYPEGQLPMPSTSDDNKPENLLEQRYETGNIKTYTNPEFRLSARYAINDNLSVKAGFNTMTQYIHKLSNTSVMSPTDIWKLSDNNIKPQTGWQASLGLYAQTDDKQYEFSVEGYIKRMNDYLAFRNSVEILRHVDLETDVIATEGKAAGVELQVKKPQGKLNGWLSYCYSRTFIRQNDSRIANPVNNGDWYPTEYDRPHEVKAVLNYKFTERYSFSSNFNYATGRPTTIPAGQYYDRSTGAMQPFYTERNSYRLPDYMRLDLAFNIEPTHKKTAWLHTSFSVGVYNVTARKNAYSIYYVVEQGKVKGYKLSVFGTAIPYVSVNFKF